MGWGVARMWAVFALPARCLGFQTSLCPSWTLRQGRRFPQECQGSGVESSEIYEPLQTGRSTRNQSGAIHVRNSQRDTSPGIMACNTTAGNQKNQRPVHRARRDLEAQGNRPPQSNSNLKI